MISKVIGSAEIQLSGLDKLLLQKLILLFGFREEHLQIVNVNLISFFYFVSICRSVWLSVCSRFYMIEDSIL
jgi:hypothetical protein